MGLGDFFRAETLDTRFQVPSGSAVSLPSATPSRWRSTEFYIYYLAFLTVPVLMLRAIWQISQPSHPTYPHYQPLLEPGWIPGRLIDNSDVQYGGFRGNLPYLAIIVVLHPLLRRAYEAWNGKREGGGVKTTADARMEARLRFDVAFAAVYLLGLHGISAFKILLILYLNFEVATALPVSVVPVATWTFNVGILFTNELCRGYSAADLAALLLPSTITVDSTPPASHVWGAWLDSFGGLLPRWEILFNITVLKMIAFNFDRLWSLDRRAASPVEVQVFYSSESIEHRLTYSRRKTSIPLRCPRQIVSNRGRAALTSASGTTWPTLYTPLSTLSGRSSTSTTTSRKYAILYPLPASPEFYLMPFASSSAS